MTIKVSTHERGSAAGGTPLTFPQLEIPKIEMPAALREFTIQGIDQARMNYEKMKVAAAQWNGIAELTCSITTHGAASYRDKVIEVMRVNTNTAFDFAIEAASAGSMFELAELSMAHARQQFELFFEQNKELWVLAYPLAPTLADLSTTSGSKAIRSLP